MIVKIVCHLNNDIAYNLIINIMYFFLPIDRNSSSDESFIHKDSSDDEKTWVKDVRKQYRLIKRSRQNEKEDNEKSNHNMEILNNQPNLYEIKEDVEFKEAKPVMSKRNK